MHIMGRMSHDRNQLDQDKELPEHDYVTQTDPITFQNVSIASYLQIFKSISRVISWYHIFCSSLKLSHSVWYLVGSRNSFCITSADGGGYWLGDW